MRRFLKYGGGEPTKAGVNGELNIPERKPVPKLRQLESIAVSTHAAAASAPAATPAGSTQNDDSMKAQREQIEIQRREHERRMLEARMKSAIIATNTSNPATAYAQPTGGGIISGNDGGDPGQASAGVLGGGSGDRGAQDPNSRLARAVSGNGVVVSRANQIDNLAYKILQGKMIEAVLEP
jgi:type IV secretion system protein VirB10